MPFNDDSRPDDRAEESWTITARTPDEADVIAIMKMAGVRPEEVRRAPNGEIVVNLAGVRKMAACAPDPARGARFVAFAEQISRGPSGKSAGDRTS